VAVAQLTPNLHVRLVAHDGVLEYEARLLADDGTHLVVEAEFAGTEDRDLGFVMFEAGDVWTEHYWRDRWYSIKAVRSSEGVLKGWYCDAAWPAEICDGELLTVDLELDLWVSADRTQMLRLDEEEFVAFGVAARNPTTAQAARDAIDECERLARLGAAPFDRAR
jgi:predicted RNA-binding protein associated with RNAse of E/G family